jgi:hypothetical protein
LSPSQKKLMLLVALPVTGALILAGVWFALPEPPAPPPTPNQAPEPEPPQPDPGTNEPEVIHPIERPDPEPVPNAPRNPEVAEAMRVEAFEGLKRIRSRLELKYKYADYQHDTAWTVEGVVRRPERLNGEYFEFADFKLSFPVPEEANVELSVATAKGVELPDGPLALRVNLGTGESEETGEVFARDHNGRVLLLDKHYAEATDVIMSVMHEWISIQNLPEGEPRGRMLEYLEDRLEWRLDNFERGDLVLGKKLSNGRLEFSLRTYHGHELSWPAVVYYDPGTENFELVDVQSPRWMPVPDDADRLKSNIRWDLRWSCEQVFHDDEYEPVVPDSVSTDILDTDVYVESRSEPSDWTVELVPGDSPKVIVELHSSFGRPLPFGKLRFVYDSEHDEGSFESP